MARGPFWTDLKTQIDAALIEAPHRLGIIAVSEPLLRKTHLSLPPPLFDDLALVLQGGGALGSYQAGVYQALSEACLNIDWIAGISIGAINAALIAGNYPEDRVKQLRAFWETVSTDQSPFGMFAAAGATLPEGEDVQTWYNQASALSALIFGAPGFFAPHIAPPWLWPPGSPNATSFVDMAPLRASLEQFIDFDLLNSGVPRFSVGAVNVTSGNFAYFDTTTHVIGPEHILASAALPPFFAPVEIEGELYWDGGLVSNTPLDWIMGNDPQRDTLVFQVDLWNTRGERPEDMSDVITRQKEIQYASRTRASTDSIRRLQRTKNMASALVTKLAAHAPMTDEDRAAQLALNTKVCRIVHLIYHARPHHGSTKDFVFARHTVMEHWETGYSDAVRTLRHPEALTRPTDAASEGVETFDVAVDGRI